MEAALTPLAYLVHSMSSCRLPWTPLPTWFTVYPHVDSPDTPPYLVHSISSCRAPLTALTLRPQTGELLLERGELADLLLVEPGLQRLAVFAHGVPRRVQRRLAPDARLPLLGERSQTADL